MNRKKVGLFAAALLLTVIVQPISFSQAANSGHKGHSQLTSFYPSTGKSMVPVTSATSVAGGIGAVTYQPGGTIISKPNVYLIWYGNWDTNSCSPKKGISSTPSIITDFIGSLGESEWNRINTSYYQQINGKKTFVQPTSEVEGCTVDPGSQGLSLDSATGAQVSDVVDQALSTKKMMTDANGVYFVLTASNVSVADFPTVLCAYHWFYDNGKAIIKYAFIGDASVHLDSCSAQPVNSPNGNAAADAMVSVIAHEFVEVVSDPEGLTWFDQVGLENADKCAWTYGKASKTANGSFANMTLNDRQYLIQQNVAANTNTCVLSRAGNQSEDNSNTNNNN